MFQYMDQIKIKKMKYISWNKKIRDYIYFMELKLMHILHEFLVIYIHINTVFQRGY